MAVPEISGRTRRHSLSVESPDTRSPRSGAPDAQGFLRAVHGPAAVRRDSPDRIQKPRLVIDAPPRPGDDAFDEKQRRRHDQITAWLDTYGDEYTAFAVRRTGDLATARQIVGDAVAKVYEYDKPITENARSFGFQTISNLIVDWARDKRHLAPLEAVFNHPSGSLHANPEIQSGKTAVRQALIAAWPSLLPHHKRVIECRFLRGMSLKETAAEMGRDVNNIKVMQFRALADLKKRMVELGVDADLAFA